MIINGASVRRSQESFFKRDKAADQDQKRKIC